MYKRVAIIERINHYNGQPSFICIDIFTTKRTLQEYLDMLNYYGEAILTNFDDVPLDVKTLWAKKRDAHDFGFIKYTESGSEAVFNYRVRMKELDRVH